MDLDVKLYKSFFVLKVEENQDIFNISSKTRVYDQENKKIFISDKYIDTDTFELKIMWETIREIRTEEIDDFGEIETNIQKLKEVNQSFVWFKGNKSPFVFVFCKKFILLKDVQDILSKCFGVRTWNVSFTNEFFNHLLNSKIISEVQTTSYQTNKENLSSFTLSGTNIQRSDIFDIIHKKENNITEMTVILRNYSKVKIYKNTKITIYNTPSIYDVFDTISDLSFLLLEGGYSLD